MDDDKTIINDDEFHFTEAEETKLDDFAVSTDEPDKKPIRINRRSVLIAVGIIVVAFSFYKFIGIFFNSEPKKTVAVATSSKSTTLPVSTITSQNSTLPAVDVQALAQQAVPENNAPDLSNQLAEMHENNAATNQQIAAISEQLSSLNVTTQNLASAITSINQQLNTYNAKIESTQQAIIALKPKPMVRTKHRYKAPVLTWYIQALIPGRAWLVAANGETTTVSRGTPLFGYGRVTYVSVIHGLVKTSSGAILRFSDP